MSCRRPLLILIVPLAFCFSACFSAATADDKSPSTTYTDPANTDADFAAQGEYTAVIPGNVIPGDGAVGVQVIAQGNGKFHAAFYMGGLPGDGWDKKHKSEVDGETKDGVTLLANEKGLGHEKGAIQIKGGKLTLLDAESHPVTELKRVERRSPTLGKKPPKGAVVLFDGTSAEAFDHGRIDDAGLLPQGVTSKRKFGDCSLHIEFRTPYMPTAAGQGRGNSGCYLQGRYEVQILDSFGLAGKDNECGGIYSIRVPDQNMCFPPLAWQTYDIDYTAARFDAAGKKAKNATMTVRHNGVVIHEQVELPHATTAAPVAEGPDKGPLFLQDHGNPVRFRNIWLVER
ncbi:MAG TPA: DUF1080 domain-containing protein [Pirellulales bacterium]|nr:DUF1080 domain-containing protein [Pirellulales bacterium]